MNIHIVVRSYLVFLTLASVLVACNSDAPTGSNSSEGKNCLAIASNGEYSAIQDPANQYNFYGEMHNRGLDYVFNQIGSPVSLNTPWREAIRDFFVADTVLNPDSVSTFMPAFQQLEPYLAEDSINAIYAILGLSSQERAILDRIFAVPDMALTSDSTLKEFSRIETDILSSTTLSNAQKALPLAVVAVAKHSTVYWFAHADTITNKSRTQDHSGKLDKIVGTKKPSTAHEIIKADAIGMAAGAVAGFVGGAIKGFIGGLMVGGPGGAIAGSAAGALSGSGYTAITGAVGNSVAEGIRRNGGRK